MTTTTTSIHLGPLYAGLALAAQLIDTAGVAVGAPITTSFVEVGSNGDYLWTADTSAVAQGGVKIYEDGAPETVLAVGAIGPSGLTAQDVRDAMMLAPTAGDPAAGSVDAHLDSILEDTSTTLDDKLDAIGLIVNNIDVSDVTYVAQSNSGYLTITIGLTYNKYVTGLVIPVDWEKAYFTVKNDLEDEESESLIQLVVSNPADSETDGVRYLNGVLWHETVEDDPETDDDESDPEPYDKDLGALTVTQAAGRIDIYLTDELTVQLSTAKRIGWDVKFIDANGDSSGSRGIMDMIKTETQTV